jgi:hypothetical protein
VADAFIRSRLEGRGHRHFGTLPRGVDTDLLLRRADPHEESA